MPVLQVEWGSHTLVQATRELMRAGLADPLNQKFVLLSEACLPLYPPAALYVQMLSEDRSRVNSCGPGPRQWVSARRFFAPNLGGIIGRFSWIAGTCGALSCAPPSAVPGRINDVKRSACASLCAGAAVGIVPWGCLHLGVVPWGCLHIPYIRDCVPASYLSDALIPVSE